MNALNMIKDRRLVMLQEGVATSDEAVQSRIANLLLSDTDPVMGSCGGVMTSYLRGRLRTAISAQATLTYACAQVKIGLESAGDTEVRDIRMTGYSSSGTTVVLTVTLVLADSGRTLSFNLQLQQ